MTAHQILIVVAVLISIVGWYIGFSSASHIEKKVKEVEDLLSKVLSKYENNKNT